jgi:hypothetical protein
MATLAELIAQRAAERQGGPSLQDLLAQRAAERQAPPPRQPMTPAQQADATRAFDQSFQPRGPAGMSIRSANEIQPPQPPAPGIMQTIRDNVMGDNDPNTMNAGERAAAFLNRAGETMTLGVVGDEAAAAADALIGRGTYDERLANYRKQEEDLGAGGRFAADVAGVLAAPAGAATRFVMQAPTRAAQVLRAATAGAGAGATQGFMEGEGGLENRATNAAVVGALGGLFGAAAPKITDVLTNIPRGLGRLFNRSQERPTVDLLRNVKNAAYRAVDEAGVAFGGDDMARLSSRVREIFEADNYVDDVDDASRAVLRVLDGRKGQPTTLGQLDSIRQNLWARYSRASDQPRILDAIAAIDNMVETGSRLGGDLMDAARAANARFAKTQLLENAFTRAQDVTAATGSGGNIVNKYRQAVASIINNRREARFFSQAEIDAMRAFVRGSMTENMQRLIGKLSPSGNGLMMALHVVGGVSSGGVTLPLMAVGAGAKNMADRGVMRGADVLMDMTSGMRTPQSLLAPPVNPLVPAATMLAVPQLEDAGQPAQNVLRLAQ